MRLLEGVVAPPDTTDAETIDLLRDEIAQLRDELSTARREASTAKRDAARGLGELRRLLGPFYQALSMVFGEMDAAGVRDAGTPAPDSRTAAVWQAWKDRVGGQPAKLIDAFLLHGEMTSGQIAVAIQISPKNVAQVVHKLNKLSLIQKNGDKFSLKKL